MTAPTHQLDLNQYVKFRDFVCRQTGLHFPEKKRADLERGVLHALSRSTYDSLDEYFKALNKSPRNGEMEELISSLTIGETYFYRDEGQFELLRRHILPTLITERAVTTRKIRVWSAGCATGEEPFSIAIILRELIPYIDTWDVTILATDINHRSLAQARKAHYNQWSFRAMPPEWLDKYFFASSEKNFHLSDTIKQMVTFDRLNLKDKTYPSFINNTAELDLIVCRNVAIYFDKETTDEIMDRYYHALADGGYLMTGASDPIPPAEVFWARNFSGAFIYQKKAAGFDARRKPRRPQPKTSASTKAARAAAPVADKKPAARAVSVDPLAEARLFLAAGQPLLAATKIEERLKKNPHCLDTLALMAKIKVALGQLAPAREWVEKIIKIDKLNIQAYHLLSAIAQGMGDEEEAIRLLKKTIYLDKNFIPGHFALGCLYKKRKKPQAAEKSFKNVVRLMVGRSKDEIVPESNGITYGKLLEIAKANL